MKKKSEEAWSFIAFNCPVNDTGHFTVNEETATVRHRRNPARTEVEFDCPSCHQRHMIVLRGSTPAE